ncbi:MAG: hypothetical protein ACREN5_01955 [Gemmatimonadales bacterium]
MTLIDRVRQALQVDEGQAEKGVGLLLLAVRFTVDGPTFSRVKELVPEAESAMGRSLMSSAAPARTGELSAMVGAKAMLNGLKTAGYRDDQLPALAHLVFGEIRDVVGEQVIQGIVAQAPALRSFGQ